MPEYIQPFTQAEQSAAANAVQALVHSLQGRKLEEDDWTKLYCSLKGAPHPG